MVFVTFSPFGDIPFVIIHMTVNTHGEIAISLQGACFKRSKLTGNSDNFPPDCNVYNPRASWQESDYVALMRMFRDRPSWEQVCMRCLHMWCDSHAVRVLVSFCCAGIGAT